MFSLDGVRKSKSLANLLSSTSQNLTFGCQGRRPACRGRSKNPAVEELQHEREIGRRSFRWGDVNVAIVGMDGVLRDGVLPTVLLRRDRRQS